MNVCTHVLCYFFLFQMYIQCTYKCSYMQFKLLFFVFSKVYTSLQHDDVYECSYMQCMLLFFSFLNIYMYVRGHSTFFHCPWTAFCSAQVHPDPKYYKYPQTDYSWPSWKPGKSNLELDPSKPFLLDLCISLYFTFSSCFIFKLSATYIVRLYPSRDFILFF